MCGITAIYNYRDNTPPINREELRTIRDYMTPRGPDGLGEWFSQDGRVGIGHRRLAIIDLTEKGAQPMKTRDGRFVITFNGEIYNYRDLRKFLENKGHTFASQSDTEVLLYLYAEKGWDMVDDLRGMYAFALWDSEKKGFLLARDPYGIKPLYYSDDGKVLRVASQVKALRAGKQVSGDISPAGAVGFFLLGSVPEPHTLYRDIHALPAGSTMWVDGKGASQPRKFFSIAKVYADAPNHGIPPENAQSTAREALLDSVRAHFVADVPVGIFLSSGIDSSSLVGLAREAGFERLQTMTLAFKEFYQQKDDEAMHSKDVAKLYETQHLTRYLEREEFERDLEKALQAMDQPSIDGVNTYFISKIAAERGLKVVLSGIGGDELLGGYDSFRQIPLLTRYCRLPSRIPLLGKAFQLAYSNLVAKIFHLKPKAAGLLTYGGTYAGAYFLRRGLFMPWELDSVLDQGMVREGLRQLSVIDLFNKALGDGGKGAPYPFAQITTLESSFYLRNQLLRDTDWAGMAHSVEIRTPFVDSQLLIKMAPVLMRTKNCSKKYLLYNSLSKKLPAQVIHRQKTGFSIPIQSWLEQNKNPARFFENSAPWQRQWAKRVYHPSVPRKRRYLALVPDAFGGQGGIAKYNRDLLSALCADPLCEEVTAFPRIIPKPTGILPDKLTYVQKASGSKMRYIRAIVQRISKVYHCDLILCAHLNLMPLAWALKLIFKKKIILFLYGIDAWAAPANPALKVAASLADIYIHISTCTKEKFMKWANVENKPSYLLPPAIDLGQFKPGPADPALSKTLKLEGKKVILTLGRMASKERYKGFDEVLEVMPELLKHIPNIIYIAAGEGDDKGRLEMKARQLELNGHVLFPGFVSEDKKPDYYRLADAFVLPSRGEGFGIVLLEAMACGVPVIASTMDGSREALCDGKLGLLVNPADPHALSLGIRKTIEMPKGLVPTGLKTFSFPVFQGRVWVILNKILEFPMEGGK